MEQVLKASGQEAVIPRDAGAPPYLVGRFPVQRRLGGACGRRTLLGTDPDTGGAVVLKVVPAGLLPSGSLMRLEHEAALLRRVQTPWLPRLIDVIRENGSLVLVSTYVPGISLETRLRRGPLDLEETFAVGRAVFAALAEMHRHRLLHRSMRPANIILNPQSRLTSAMLVDFGPARAIQDDVSQRAPLLKAAVYLSPEQAGSIDQDTTEASDLYSAGIVLFHCLAGHPPFRGDTIGTVLFEHMTARVPSLRSLGIDAPRAFEEMVGRLLQKDPRDRYQSAEAVLADLDALVAQRNQGNSDPAIVIGATDRRGTLTEPAFVARNSEIEQLDGQVRSGRAGPGGVVLLEGESGSGKTRLLAEVAQRAAGDGLWVLRGQGTGEVGQQPFRVLGGIVEGVLAACKQDSHLAEAVRRRLGGYRAAVAAALPRLAPLLDAGSAEPTGPEATGETRTIQALGRLLDALGTPERPALVILDDCQWADELTCKLIRRWQMTVAGAGPRERHVSVIAAFRSEEVPEGHLLRRTSPSRHLCLSPFAPEEVRQLVESMAGPLPEAAVEVVVRLAAGSPFMASAVLRGLVESRAVVAGPEGWRVDPSGLACAGSSSRAGAFLARRLELLPAETIELLSTAAVLGKEFELDIAARLAGQSPSAAIAALEEARRRRLVWSRPDEARCVFIHDQIRAALLERLSGAERRGHHRRAALHLRQHDPERVCEVAYHFDAAGDSRSALPYALEAAEQARAQHALEVAEQQYRIAQRGAASADRATRYHVAEGLGDVLMLRGRYDAAEALFESAAAWAEGRFARAHIRGKIGEVAFKRGDMERAVGDSEAALRLLGMRVPRGRLGGAVRLVREVAVQLLHTFLPSLLVHRLGRPPNDAERLSIRLFSNLAHGCWYCRSKVFTMWAHLRGMNLAERYAPTLELAQAYGEHAPAIALVPMFRRAVVYAEKAVAVRKAFDDQWGQGQALVYFGIALYAASRFSECVEKCREAIRLLERIGDYWMVHMARYQIAASLYHLGDLQGAVEESRLNHQSGLETGDEQASGIILDVWARAAAGAVPEPVLRREFERPRHDAQGKAQVLLAEGVHQLCAGDPERAVAILEEGFDVAERAGIRNAYTLPNLAWAATARRRLAEKAHDYTPHRRRTLLRRAAAAARRALHTARLCRNDLPHALREYALIQAMRGRRWAARRCFDRSLAVARRQQARYEYALTLQARARVGREWGWPEAEEQAVEARALLAELHAFAEPGGDSPARDPKAPTLSLVDRFDTVLASGHKIASALSTQVVYEEACEAAVRLLRAQRCLILQVDSTSEPTNLVPVVGDTEGRFEVRIVRSALEAGRTLAVSGESGGADVGSPSDSGARSVLCAPVYVRGRVAACLYAAHDHLRDLFGPDEERLADFIATIAGAALENAEGFAHLRRWNETLEARVAERTAAAVARAKELAHSNGELQRTADELRQIEAQLRDANRAAEAASRAKSRFLATMSHEIRTPMNGILGMTELTLNTGLTDRQHHYITSVQQSGNALLTLLNDVLDFSKIEAERMELENIDFDLWVVVEDAARLLECSAAAKNLELVCRIAPDVPAVVTGDPGRLRQILANLLSNAVKFTERGRVLLDAQRERAGERQAVLHFAVEDTGIGIPADKQQAIFEAFRQSDSSTTRRYGGTGLGLTVSAQLAALMGGRIWVDSEVGRGSTFHVVVPLRLPPSPRPGPPAGAEPDRPAEADCRQAEPPEASPLRVLLAEDDPVNQEVAVGLLELRGHRVEVACNGREAVDLFRREPFDLVLMDVEMPEMDGLAAAAAIRDIEHAGGTHTPIVAMTAHAQQSLRHRCLSAGMDGCVAKPIQPHQLYRVLQTAAATGR